MHISFQDEHLIISNLGDSRAILCTRDDENQLIPIQLTVDLKPSIPSKYILFHSLPMPYS